MTVSNKKIDVSFVMTVYNKEYYLPAVLEALLNQTGLKNPEFIFVDDVSSDHSVDIIHKKTKNIKNVTIVTKNINNGTSISINQGIKLAHGDWVRMLDSDDILPLNSTEIMLKLALKHNADMVYGCFKKTGAEPESICHEKMSEDFQYNYKEDAMRAILKGRFTRMGQLIRRKVIQKAGGADTRVFIQDESIPLRAARLAKGVIKIFADVVLVPKETNNLSKNTVQLDNDRFFAHYDMLLDYYEDLDKDVAALIYMKALSANWKFVKKNFNHPYWTADFLRYVKAKIFRVQPDFAFLEQLAHRFLSLDNVLRSRE